MPSLTIEAKTTVLAPPVADETQKRFENELVGTPGASATSTENKPEPQGTGDSGIRMGFQPPTDRRRLDALLAEIHAMLNPISSMPQPTPQDSSKES